MNVLGRSKRGELPKKQGKETVRLGKAMHLTSPQWPLNRGKMYTIYGGVGELYLWTSRQKPILCLFLNHV